jgi:antitoxin PrlF
MRSHYFRDGNLQHTLVEQNILQSESTLTDRYQTTIPDVVRKALGLTKRDKIAYTIQPNGQVILSRVTEAESDPVLEPFLDFLAQDIRNHPQNLQAVSQDWVRSAQSLVVGVAVDLDAPLAEEDE